MIKFLGVNHVFYVEGLGFTKMFMVLLDFYIISFT